jgi:hypothetical protein
MDAMFIATIVAGIIPGLIVIGALTLWLSSKRRKIAHLDEWWGWLGPGRPWQGSGREFDGNVGGRRVKVTWFDSTTTLTVECSPTIHAGFGRSDRPAQVVDEANEGGRRVILDAEHVAYGETRGDVRVLMAHEGVREALDLLLSDDERSLRSVDVVPGSGVTWFARNLREIDMTPGWTRRLVDAVTVIARAAERPRSGLSEPLQAEA